MTTTQLLDNIRDNLCPVWREQHLVAGLCSRDAQIARLQFLLWYRHHHCLQPLTAEEADHITQHSKRALAAIEDWP